MGKGLDAKLLAEKLGWELVNADLDLESRIGRSIEDIAGDNFGNAFYQNVIEILSAQSSKQNIVINTDPHIQNSGGKPCQSDGYSRLNFQ
ncbi:shikimate kinase [Legionella sp. CNM-4043-24]|uniref:shikimate kinase n=1 Tax=Legionella sp. CNM-4043-24 TaxID=3421646 RepID=UPI00403B0296